MSYRDPNDPRQAEVFRRYREKNREGIRSRLRARRLEIRLWLNAQKDKPCMDCGGSFPMECMDFDHVRGKKLFNLASTVTTIKARLEAEIAKCEVVCANCHRIRTHRRGNGRRNS